MRGGATQSSKKGITYNEGQANIKHTAALITGENNREAPLIILIVSEIRNFVYYKRSARMCTDFVRKCAAFIGRNPA